MDKKIVIGCDHGGFKLKENIKKYLLSKRYKVKDMGTHSTQSCDYPLIGYEVAKAVSKGKFKRGIVICKTGIGMSIIANKLPRVRSGACANEKQAETSRLHNDTNVLSLGAAFVGPGKARKILDIWLNTKALPGRHGRRVRQIKKLEKKK